MGKTFLIDNHGKVSLDGDYKIKTFKLKDKASMTMGLFFWFKTSYNVNAFHHGTLLRSISQPHIQQYVFELIDSINDSDEEKRITMNKIRLF